VLTVSQGQSLYLTSFDQSLYHLVESLVDSTKEHLFWERNGIACTDSTKEPLFCDRNGVTYTEGFSVQEQFCINYTKNEQWFLCEIAPYYKGHDKRCSEANYLLDEVFLLQKCSLLNLSFLKLLTTYYCNLTFPAFSINFREESPVKAGSYTGSLRGFDATVIIQKVQQR
jgi:hypothetical protein